MENEEIIENIQGAWVSLVLTLLVSVYCFSVSIESIPAHNVWKTVCFIVGFIIVSAITVIMLIRLIDLKKLAKEIPGDSE